MTDPMLDTCPSVSLKEVESEKDVYTWCVCIKIGGPHPHRRFGSILLPVTVDDDG